MAHYVHPPDSVHWLKKDATTGHILWMCNGVPVLYLDVNNSHFQRIPAPLEAGLPLDELNKVFVDGMQNPAPEPGPM